MKEDITWGKREEKKTHHSTVKMSVLHLQKETGNKEEVCDSANMKNVAFNNEEIMSGSVCKLREIR